MDTLDYTLLVFAGVGAVTVAWYGAALVRATFYVYQVRRELVRRVGQAAMRIITASPTFTYLLRENFKARVAPEKLAELLVKLFEMWQAQQEAAQAAAQEAPPPEARH